MKFISTLICKLKKILTLVPVILCLFCPLTYAQREQPVIQNKNLTLGVSLQLYPAGIISTIDADLSQNKNASLVVRLGGNFADRKDFSRFHDHEQGAGFGGTLGYRKHFILPKGEFIAGLNTDLWNLWINWKDEGGFIGEI
ncbi:MAG: hypothetical protein WAT91_10785, partial [Saprospiraceae bacterium]